MSQATGIEWTDATWNPIRGCSRVSEGCRHCYAESVAGVPFFFKQWGEWAAGSMHVTSGDRVFRQFTSYQEWTHKGDTWINGGICLDATGKQMKNGGDMQAATYPVTVIHRVGKKAAGHLLDGEVIQQFPEGIACSGGKSA